MMRTVFGYDKQVASWGFKASNSRPILYDMCVGVADDAGNIVGGLLFTGFNGSDVEVQIYAPRAFRRNILREVAIIALKLFKVNRVTTKTAKPHVERGLRKIGGVFEGKFPQYYGPTDAPEHTATQLGFYRPTLLKLAGLEE